MKNTKWASVNIWEAWYRVSLEQTCFILDYLGWSSSKWIKELIFKIFEEWILQFTFILLHSSLDSKFVLRFMKLGGETNSVNGIKISCTAISETYLKPSRTSTIELFYKKPSTIFAKKPNRRYSNEFLTSLWTYNNCTIPYSKIVLSSQQ